MPRNPLADLQRLQVKLGGVQTRIDGLAALQREQTPATPPGAPPAVQPRTEIPGVEYVKTEPREPVILEADKLEKLGIAAGRTWYAWRDREVRVDLQLGPIALGDSLPPNRVLLHRTEVIAAQTVDESDPAKPWAKGQRKHLPAQRVERYWRCTLMDPGSFAAAAERDARRKPKPTAQRQAPPPTRVDAANAPSVAFWSDRRAGRSAPERADR